MALSKLDILSELKQGRLIIKPLSLRHLQSAGIQLSLGNRLARSKEQGQKVDPLLSLTPEWEVFEIPAQGYPLYPGGFVLGQTFERIAIPTDILAMVDGKSSFGRWGVTTHLTAMAIWPGHGYGPKGARSITLEIKNHGEFTFILRPKLFVANVTFHRLETPVDVAYDAQSGSRYAADEGILLPKVNGDFLGDEEFIKDVNLISDDKS